MKFWKSGKIRNLLVVAVFTFLAFQVTTFAGKLDIVVNDNLGGGIFAVSAVDTNGAIQFTLEVHKRDLRGIRAFYADFPTVSDTQLSDITITETNGTNITDTNINIDSVVSVGSSPLSSSGASNPGPFDIGIEFETPNPSTNGINEVSFILSDASDPNNDNPLSIENLSEQTIGIVLENGNDEIIEHFAILPIIQPSDTDEPLSFIIVEETLLLGAPENENIIVANPEPTTVLLLGIGLAGMAGVSLRRMRKTAQRKKLNQ
ncbi:MAG: PEP-CTERM sorting domain-containing protein [Candidatus Brocadiaceae bacterium]|nr:PEP-CTERM sorting domain-containing protein [Candidatus Brocadiaceae bacterium]